MLNRELAAIQAAGKLEAYLTEISNFKQILDRAPWWRPGTALLKQCDEAMQLIRDMTARMERKLLITLIGPSGSGKSTLLNALAGRDDMSPAGTRRPTTENVVVFCQYEDDAQLLMDKLGPPLVTLHSEPRATELEHLILIDTPDTDSTHQERHIPIIEKVIALSDLLICVFDSENPKRRDHADFMAGKVQRFNGDSLVVLLNKCDRLDGRELSEKILPEFDHFIRQAWDKPIARVLCTSGRTHLKDPRWDERALPRNDLDQFAELKQLLFDTFNRSGYRTDRRLENARAIRDYMVAEITTTARTDAKALDAVIAQMRESERTAMKHALEALGNDEERQVLGINLLLYQKLSQRWLGPVGWMVALWGRVLVFGLGFTAMLRFGNPVRQLWGMAATLRHYKAAKGALEISQEGGGGLESALAGYRAALMRHWPDIAEALVLGRMDRRVRDVAEILPDSQLLVHDLSKLWQCAVQTEVQKTADLLSHLMLQLLFNLPVVGILGYAGWLTATHFFSGQYLNTDFFMHAMLTIVFVLLLSFFLLQGIIRLTAGKDRIHRRAFRAVQAELQDYPSLSQSPLSEQLAAIINLSQRAESHYSGPEHSDES